MILTNCYIDAWRISAWNYIGDVFLEAPSKELYAVSNRYIESTDTIPRAFHYEYRMIPRLNLEYLKVRNYKWI